MNVLITEFIGTLILLLSVLFLNNKIAISVGFYVAILVAGLLGGQSHLNPVVSIVMALKGSLPIEELAPYIIAQIAGGAAAFGVSNLVPKYNPDYSVLL